MVSLPKSSLLFSPLPPLRNQWCAVKLKNSVCREVQRKLWFFSLLHYQCKTCHKKKLMAPSKKFSLLWIFLAVWVIISKLVLIKQSKHLPKGFVKNYHSLPLPQGNSGWQSCSNSYNVVCRPGVKYAAPGAQPSTLTAGLQCCPLQWMNLVAGRAPNIRSYYRPHSAPHFSVLRCASLLYLTNCNWNRELSPSHQSCLVLAKNQLNLYSIKLYCLDVYVFKEATYSPAFRLCSEFNSASKWPCYF